MDSKLELFSPFMVMPTMRSIEAHDVDGRNVQWRWGTGFSQVTDVKLECDIDTITLTNHIGAVNSLETFTYTFYPSKQLSIDTFEDEQYSPPPSPTFRGSGWDTYDTDYSSWGPRAIAASLQLHACDLFLSPRADSLYPRGRYPSKMMSRTLAACVHLRPSRKSS